jgi:hypothetical protein
MQIFLHTYAKPYPYEHLRRTEPVHHEIHETSHTTKRIVLLNPEIKFRKMLAPVPSKGFEPGWADSDL